MDWCKDNYRITDDVACVELNTVHRLLAATYWGKRRPRDTGLTH